jgi:hypothetical protein
MIMHVEQISKWTDADGFRSFGALYSVSFYQNKMLAF